MVTKEEIDREWNKYFIPNTNVLINNLGITSQEELQEKEIEITFKKLLELYEEPIEMNFDDNHLKEIHKYLFEDIYPFAGKYRTVYMQKNNSYFASVDQIDFRVKYALKQMEEESKTINTKYDFACFLSDYYIELLQIHPFREGNGRTIREFIREYANCKSKDLSFGKVDFSWANVDSDAVNEVIDKSLAFKSIIELEFLKALESDVNEKGQSAIK